MSPEVKDIMYRQIDEMLSAGVIEPSSSSYSSPVVIDRKEGKKPRFCIDFKLINKITVDEPSVLPKIHDTIKDLGSSTIFSVLDLKSGYWQVPLDPSSKPYTAFSTPDGALYQFTVMPFGLKNAPGTFQRLMTNEVLCGYLNVFCKVYLDDIIIYSSDMASHINHLRLIFERLRIHNLKVSPEKCQFATSELDYLGHHISGGTITPQEKHILAVKNFKPPGNKKQLQSFLGTCNWIREYVPHMSEIIAPLTPLLHKNTKFRWLDSHQLAFELIKEKLSQPLFLHRPDFSKPFYLQTDASSVGMGCVLFQKNETNDERQIISYSR